MASDRLTVIIILESYGLLSWACQDVKEVNVSIPVAVLWSRTHKILSHVCIEPPETCRDLDGIFSFHLQITG
jgi:hypothetical protein